MVDDYLIGIDLGTSTIKTSLFDSHGIRLAAAARDVSISHPAPGQSEQHTDDYYRLTLDSVREVVDKSGAASNSVAAMAFAGQMGGIMAIDRDWQALTPWYPSTLDKRYLPYLAPVLQDYGTQLLEIAGATPIAAPRMLLWQREQPDLYRRVYKVLILANYVAGRMAGLQGEDAFIDPSYLTWMGLADTGRRVWSEALCSLWGVDQDKLPRIVPATNIIGHLDRKAAAACGLVSGVPLVAGTGDSVASFLGSGLVDVGQLIDIAGTFPVFATCLDQFLVDTRFQTFQSLAGPLSEAHWYSLMYIGGGGLTHRWFLEQLAGPEEQANRELAELFAAMAHEAARLPPGAEGLLMIPHLLGRACPDDPAVRGAWVGFTWTHHKAHFYRAYLESIAYEYAHALAVMRAYFPDVTFADVRVIGGGARSKLWNQIKADVLGLSYQRLVDADRANLGAAIVAGHAVGLYADMAQAARQFAEAKETVTARPPYHDYYRGYVSVYSAIFDHLRDTFEALAQLRERPFQA